VHELSITESILETTLKYGKKENAQKVTDIYLAIGDLSMIIDDSIQFYWDIISENTICEKAKLHFNRIPANILCQDCGQEYSLTSELIPCPKCHGMNLKILSGDEFRMESIEIQKNLEKV